jgi:hypothetical protein
MNLASVLTAAILGGSLLACSGNDARIPKRNLGTGADPTSPAGGPGGGGSGADGAEGAAGAPGAGSGTGAGSGAGSSSPADDGPWPGSQVIFLPFAAQRAMSNPAWGAALTDLVQHVPPIYGGQYDEPADPIAWGEIATIGIDGHLRVYVNPYAASGQAANGFYVMKDRMAFVLEPAVTLTQALSYVPASLEGALYASSLSPGVADWDATPTYVLDEWITQTNGAEVAVELGTSGAWTAPRHALDGALELTLDALALAAATEALDPTYFAAEPQLRELVAWNAERALGLYRAGVALPVYASPDAAALYAAWKTSADASGLRNFARRAFGAKFCTKVLDIAAAME